MAARNVERLLFPRLHVDDEVSNLVRLAQPIGVIAAGDLGAIGRPDERIALHAEICSWPLSVDCPEVQLPLIGDARKHRGLDLNRNSLAIWGEVGIPFDFLFVRGEHFLVLTLRVDEDESAIAEEQDFVQPL